MRHPLRTLGHASLVGIADALDSGRLGGPLTRFGLAQHVPDDRVEDVFSAMVELERDGMAPRHLAHTVRLLAEERAAAQRMADRVQLVWSPAELDHVDARDTSVVVQELFRDASRNVLVTTFVLDSGAKAEALFGELAQKMDAHPELTVRLVANIQRPLGNREPDSVLVRQFAQRLRTEVWPGKRVPSLFYDPRSLAIDLPKKVTMHAKCVVVDSRWTLLTSANFTEAAQDRNIEAGVVVDDQQFAQRVERQFALLVERGKLVGVVV